MAERSTQDRRVNKCILNTGLFLGYANVHLTDNSNTARVWTIRVPCSY